MRLNQVTVGATDTAASVAFYKTLGLRLIVDSAPHYARFELPDGEATFSLHHVDAPCGHEFPLVYFETPTLDAEVERLKTLGIVFVSDPQDQRWGWREAYLRDPAGNRICLFQAGVNRRYPPWRIDIKG
jgi:catechol 2,3-dioxygenase-like lactoylglutathione lyase family enzyme